MTLSLAFGKQPFPAAAALKPEGEAGPGSLRSTRQTDSKTQGCYQNAGPNQTATLPDLGGCSTLKETLKTFSSCDLSEEFSL